MNIYITLRAIYYLMLKLVTQDDFSDKQWNDITSTVEDCLTSIEGWENNHTRLEANCKAQGQEINRLHERERYLEQQCDSLTNERDRLRDELRKRTRGKLVKMHLGLTAIGNMQMNKISAIKELRTLTDIGLADAKHAVEAAYDRPYIEVPIYEGDYRRLKDGIECWVRIPKKKKKEN